MAGDQELFNKALNNGHSAAWEQNWDDAIRFYRQALSEFPENYSALTSLGLALMENQGFEEALQCYLKAAAINPNDAVSISNIAKIQERMGRLQEAFQSNLQAAELFLKDKLIDQSLENYWHAVFLQPGNLSIRIRLATIYDHIGKKAEAAEEYLAIASLMQKNGDAVKSRQAVRYALQLVPGHPEAQKAIELLDTNQELPDPLRPKGGTGPMGMAKVRLMDEETDKVERDPIGEAQYLALVKLAGNLFTQDEDELPAGQVARRGISALSQGTGGLSADRSAKSRIQLHLSRAIDFQTQGDETQASAELERAIEIGLHQPEAYFDLGLLLNSTNQDKALTYLQQSVRHPDFCLASYLLLAKIHEQKGAYQESVVEYLHALALADGQSVEADQTDELRQLYEPIIESQSQQTDEKQLKVLCEEIAKQLLRKDWRAFLKTARQQLPPPLPGNNPLPLVTLLIETKGGKVVESLAEMRQLSAEGYQRSAMEEAFYAIPNAPTYLPLHAQMGEILAKEGRIQDAIDKFMLTSELYNLRGETNQAIQLLNRVSQIAPMDLSVRSKLIELYSLRGKLNESLQQYVILGDIYYHLAELDTARQTYLAGLKLAQESKGNRPWVIKIIAKVADIDIQRFDWRNAIRMYEQLRTLQPEEPSARAKLIDLNLRLGQTSTAMTELESYLSLLNNTGSQTEAVNFCQGLVEEHPDQSEIHQRFGELLTNAGNLKEATAELEKALQGYLNNHEPQKAAKCVQQLSTINPGRSADYRAMLGKIGNS
jgi:tetratricopeptide (TPR) repeat protein